MWALWGIDETKTIYEITGKYPAIEGHDYINESSNKSENQLVIEWWKAGGIPTLMWHWGAPSIGEGYENSKKEINIDSCFIPGTKQYIAMWSVAKEKLFDASKSISEIAYELGFRYPQHFTRMFKKNVGVSPIEYRSMN